MIGWQRSTQNNTACGNKLVAMTTTTIIPECRAFIVSADGNYGLLPENNSTYITLPLKAGYIYDIGLIAASFSTGSMWAIY